jgi:predicted MFS family arabinose efflux permease
MITAQLWKQRDYMLLWGGQVVSTLGSAASSIVYPLLVLALTHSPAAAGVVAALRAMPYLLFCLPAGALVDRWDRGRVMVLCDLGRCVAVGSVALAIVVGVLTIWQLYAVAFIEGSLFVFFNVAEVAALPRVVPTALLAEAAAQNEAAFGAAEIVGPPVGTLLFQVLGRAAPFVADAVSYLASVVSLRLIGTDLRATRVLDATQPAPRLRDEIAEGLRWLWHAPLIRYMAALTGGLNLVFAAAPLIVIVLAKQMGASDVQVGLIFSIGGIGGIIGSLVGGRIQRRFSFGQVIVAVIWCHAIAFALYAVVPNVLLLGLVTALIAWLGPVYNVVQFSYRLALIPDGLQGRVNSAFRLLAFGLNPVGAALSGVLLERFGAGPTILVFVAWYLALAVLTSLNPHVRSARPIPRQ